MQETEITVQVFEPMELIDKKLKDLGFKITRNFQLNDWYFTKFDDVKNIDYPTLINNSFLIRQVLTDNDENIHLCYKSKQLDESGNVISEEKTKTKLSDLNSTIKIFTLAKLNNWCNLKNSSSVYSNGEMELAIQNIDGLGIFIEYEENDTMHGLTKEQKFSKMCNDIKSMNLNIGSDFSCKKIYMKFKLDNK